MKVQDKENSYEDIIHLPHHVSTVHPHMPVSDRAAQFAPFAALTGYGDVIKETARQTDAKPELSEDEKEILDYKIQLACGLPGEKPGVVITYFVPDEKKTGGSYVPKCGKLKKLNPLERWIQLTDGTKIALDDIAKIESDMFKGIL